tara:strand:+ start:49 stop:945 length:897 start_codon:yes stop_codon:yes gene_type:complete
MKLLKLSLLINYFAIAKNSKRAIFLINVGLFLSIFALSAASISIYIENKVSNLEFEHLENSRAKSETEKYTKMVIDYKNKIRQYKNMEGSFEQNLEFLRLNQFGKAVSSPNDLQAYALYDLVKDEKFISEFVLIFDETNFMFDFDVFTDEEKKNYKIISENIKKTFISLEKLNPIELENIIFQRSFRDLGEEIKSSMSNKSRMKYLKDQGQFEKVYNETIYLWEDLETIFSYLLRYMNGSLITVDANLEMINEEIIDFSKKEKNIILIAFLLQLIVFIIIQFFEISSVRIALKRKKKT